MVDHLYQAAYWCAYRLLRQYWRVRHPLTHGALVAVWHGGRVLLIRNSYARFYTAPGGSIHRGETARYAAARELGEEVGIIVEERRLSLVMEITHEWDYKQDHVCLYRLELAEQPIVRVDNREVVEAGFYRPEVALNLELFPPLRRHIETALRLGGTADAGRDATGNASSAPPFS